MNSTHHVFWCRAGRVFNGFFAVVGVVTLIAFFFALADVNVPCRRHAFDYEESLSSNVRYVHKRGTDKLVTASGKTIAKGVTRVSKNPVDTLLFFVQDGKRGFVNLNTGKVAIKPQYDRAWIFSEGLAAVVKSGKLGFIRPDGSMAIPFQYEYNKDFMYDYLFHFGYCAVADSTQKMGVIDLYGNWVIKPSYDKITVCRDCFIAGNRGEFNRQIALDGHIINEGLIEGVSNLTYKETFINKEDGCPYEHTVTNKEYRKYKVFGRYGLMDKNGKYLTRPIYTNLEGYSSTLFLAALQDGCSYVIIDKNGTVVSTEK